MANPSKKKGTVPPKSLRGKRRGPDGRCLRCGSEERYSNGQCAPCQRERTAAKLETMGEGGRRAMYRARNLRSRFNLTPEEFDIILEAQGGVCAGCGRSQSELNHPLAVDHDHTTRVVRGVLCWPCNSMLPTRRNVRELFRSLSKYLDDPPAVRALGQERLANKLRRRKRRP